jgi:hypothetical protein
MNFIRQDIQYNLQIRLQRMNCQKNSNLQSSRGKDAVATLSNCLKNRKFVFNSGIYSQGID